jgi:hypothetical protein
MSLNGTVWAPVGPSPIAENSNADNGMVTAIAVNPNNPNIIYIGTTAGGVWQSRDNGANWTPLFDRQIANEYAGRHGDTINPLFRQVLPFVPTDITAGIQNVVHFHFMPEHDTLNPNGTSARVTKMSGNTDRRSPSEESLFRGRESVGPPHHRAICHGNAVIGVVQLQSVRVYNDSY